MSYKEGTIFIIFSLLLIACLPVTKHDKSLNEQPWGSDTAETSSSADYSDAWNRQHETPGEVNRNLGTEDRQLQNFSSPGTDSVPPHRLNGKVTPTTQEYEADNLIETTCCFGMADRSRSSCCFGYGNPKVSDGNYWQTGVEFLIGSSTGVDIHLPGPIYKISGLTAGIDYGLGYIQADTLDRIKTENDKPVSFTSSGLHAFVEPSISVTSPLGIGLECSLPISYWHLGDIKGESDVPNRNYEVDFDSPMYSPGIGFGLFSELTFDQITIITLLGVKTWGDLKIKWKTINATDGAIVEERDEEMRFGGIYSKISVQF